jgi:hypothetical protein
MAKEEEEAGRQVTPKEVVVFLQFLQQQERKLPFRRLALAFLAEI